MYVLKSREYPPRDMWDGYYVGSTYVFQQEVYAVCDCNIDKAKKYTSYKRAINAAECLNAKVDNYLFDVVELKEHENNA